MFETKASISSRWKNLSIAKKLYFVVGTMALLVLLELLTLHFAMTNLSAVRAFVGGEGLWSKGQKNALYQFQKYALTKDENDFRGMNEFLKIPEGDFMARMELLKTEPNMEIIHNGFIAGKIHPSDIEGMVNLLRRFHWVSFVAKAVEVWASGDELLIQFKNAADEYHHIVSSGTKKPARAKELIDRVNVLNELLSKKELEFSTVLGAGARWMEKIIFLSLFMIVVTVGSIGLVLTFFTGRSISKGLDDLNSQAEEYGLGNFERQLPVTSKDEIGKLTFAINKMGHLLSKSYKELRESHQELERKVQARTAELAATSEENILLYDKAKKALVMRDELLSIANHELRTPLTALKLQLRILERNLALNEEDFRIEIAREIVQKTNRLVRKLASLQNVLMDLTQIQLGKFELKIEKCDLALITNDCISQLSLEALRSGSKVEIKSPAALYGSFDPIRAGQVVTNLLANAIKYGEGKPVELNLCLENERALIIVTDNGPGIPEDKQEKIFERFERVSSDHALSGLGLGLYIARQIVEAHGGSLSVKNVPGKGARFMAEFPLS